MASSVVFVFPQEHVASNFVEKSEALALKKHIEEKVHTHVHAHTHTHTHTHKHTIFLQICERPCVPVNVMLYICT